MSSYSVELYPKDGQLNFRDVEGADCLVLVIYPAGDCDTFRWPLDLSYRPIATQQDNIVRAMYDAREMGQILSSVRTVILPDNTVLELDS